MRSTNSFITIPGLISTTILLVVLAIGVWRNGEQAFSPGHLSALNRDAGQLGGYDTHHDFEGRCSLCHQPLQTTQDELCLDCHTAVAGEISSGEGTHALIESGSACYTCHSDHKGVDYNLLLPGLEQFDHETTGFSLAWHQVGYDAHPLECMNCHSQVSFDLDMTRCTECHAAENAEFMRQHEVDFGSDCLGCHDGSDLLADFDHKLSEFPLLGQHADLACAACHKPGDTQSGETSFSIFENTPSACSACHAEPAVHRGLFAGDCAECHTSDGWMPASWQDKPFEHAAVSGFSLARHLQDQQGQAITCLDCHGTNIQQDTLPACESCHAQAPDGTAFIQPHVEQFGGACMECHDGVDRLSDFDHARFFVIDGAHLPLDCQECHPARRFAGTPDACNQCHEEPEIHAGFFGLECQDCHLTEAWTPAQLRQHSFPLDHGEQGIVACQTCHPVNYVEYTCYGCHEHKPAETQNQHREENISLLELNDCASCHPQGLKEENVRD